LVDGLCPDHGVAPVDYAQENYFFKMSRYRDQLLAYIDNTSFVSPNHKNNELRNFVADMEDISISRTRESLPRGVPVPGDDSQVMYVRFDALSNYVGAVGYPDNEQQFADRWSDARTLQLCGPDNLRFQ
jgi:methionyl-tRNA synthetase